MVSKVFKINENIRLDIPIKLLIVILAFFIGIYRAYTLDQKNRKIIIEQSLQKKLDKEIYAYEKQLTTQKVDSMDRMLSKMEGKIDKIYDVIIKEAN